MSTFGILVSCIVIAISSMIWGTILAGLGTVKGIYDSISGNNAANRAAKMARTADERAAATAERDYENQQKYLDELREVYTVQKDAGLYDTETRIQYAKNSADEFREDNLENTAATLKTLGYKPGDSVMQKGFAETEAIDTNNWARMVDDLRTKVPQEELTVLGMLNPKNADPSNLLNAMNRSSEFNMLDSQRRAAGVPDMSATLGAILPFLDQLNQKKVQPKPFEGEDLQYFGNQGLFA